MSCSTPLHATNYHQGKSQFMRTAHHDIIHSCQWQQTPQFKDKTSGNKSKRRNASHLSVPFDPRHLQPKWTTIRRVGPGLVNGTNTCFLNSVLQCLTYTAPFAQQLLTENHSASCAMPGFCALCAMEIHIHKVFEGRGNASAIFPGTFVYNIQAISKTFKPHQQEDAHEFLMFLFDALQKSLLYGMSSLQSNSQQLTMLHSIFGGRLRSRLRCLNCGHTSNSFESILNLSMSVHKTNTLEDTLSEFFSVEKIGFGDPENKYICETCKQKVCAEKQATISELPMTLIIHLNRFAFDFQYSYSMKVTRYIQYPEHLDMAPYISPGERQNPKNISSSYHLYAVLVHEGSSCHSGHYFAFVKNSDDQWYRMDDDVVTPVMRSNVLEQEAYILFYANDAYFPACALASKRKDNEEHAGARAQAKHQTTHDRSQTGFNQGLEAKADDIGFVQGANETVRSNQPEAWFMRSANMPYQSLRGYF